MAFLEGIILLTCKILHGAIYFVAIYSVFYITNQEKLS
jgi:hypothetical protein